MGRNKIKIEKKAVHQQLVTYNKRKAGIAKKARELSILCDTDVLLITISPKGKPDVTLGPKSNFATVVRKYAEVDPEERYNRKMETLQTLRKSFKGDDHEVDVTKLMNQGMPKKSPVDKADVLIDKILGPTIRHIDDLDNITDISLLEAIIQLMQSIVHRNIIKKNLSMLREAACQYFPMQEATNYQMTSSGNQISGHVMQPPKLSDIDKSKIAPIAAPVIKNPTIATNASNMLLQLNKEQVQKPSPRDVASTSLPVSAPSTAASAKPEESELSWVDSVLNNVPISDTNFDAENATDYGLPQVGDFADWSNFDWHARSPDL